MLEGTDIVTIVKGRISVPTRHRDILQADNEDVVLTADPRYCLLLLPLRTWMPIRERILERAKVSNLARMKRTLMVGGQRRDKLDNAGRLLITPDLLKYVFKKDQDGGKLKNKLHLVGVGDHLELWSEDGLDKVAEMANESENAPDNEELLF